jgi:hypothetical protein
MVHIGGEVGSQDAERRTLKTTPIKVGERDVEMSKASVLAEALGAITRETKRTTTAEGGAYERTTEEDTSSSVGGHLVYS